MHNLDTLASSQLWMMGINQDNGSASIFEVSKECFSKDFNIDDILKRTPLAESDLGESPDDETESFKFFLSLSMIPVCPSIYLFLEALHETKDIEAQNFYLETYANIHKYISEAGSLPVDKNGRLSPDYFKFTSDDEGYLIDANNVDVLKFTDPNLAKWVSIAVDAYTYIFPFAIEKNLKKMGLSMLLNLDKEANGLVTQTNFDYTAKIYQELKELQPKLQWNLENNLNNLKII